MKKGNRGRDITEVVNLATGEQYYYVGLTPRKAIICAFNMYYMKNSNTDTYPDDDPRITQGKHSVCLGDFAALL